MSRIDIKEIGGRPGRKLKELKEWDKENQERMVSRKPR